MKKLIIAFCLLFSMNCFAQTQVSGGFAATAPANAGAQLYVGSSPVYVFPAGTKSGIQMTYVAQYCLGIPHSCPVYIKMIDIKNNYPIVFTGTIDVSDYTPKWVVQTPVYNLYYSAKSSAYTINNGFPILEVDVTKK